MSETPSPSRPYHLTTFTLKDGGELIVLIETAGDPVKLLLPDGSEIVLGHGYAVTIGKAIQHAGMAAERFIRAAWRAQAGERREATLTGDQP